MAQLLRVAGARGNDAKDLFAAQRRFVVLRAFRLAPISILAPFQYFEIISATILGFTIFGEFPTPSKWLGIAILRDTLDELERELAVGPTGREDARAP